MKNDVCQFLCLLAILTTSPRFGLCDEPSAVLAFDAMDYPRGPLRRASGGAGWKDPWRISRAAIPLVTEFPRSRAAAPGGYRYTVRASALH
jgi:hypothetical protein